jgi:hypothetical protein
MSVFGPCQLSEVAPEQALPATPTSATITSQVHERDAGRSSVFRSLRQYPLESYDGTSDGFMMLGR